MLYTYAAKFGFVLVSYWLFKSVPYIELIQPTQLQLCMEICMHRSLLKKMKAKNLNNTYSPMDRKR